MSAKIEKPAGWRFRVAVNGLPYFCRKLSQLLRDDEEWDVPYRSYSPVGLAARFADLARCDLAYSWGARISMGKFLWTARALRKSKVVVLWSGSDVLFAKDHLAQGKMNPWVVSRIHWAVSPWLAEEVRKLGVACEYVQVSFVDVVGLVPLPEKFSVLAYLPSLKKADLYRLDVILQVARRFPGIEFNLVGLEQGEISGAPQNLKVFRHVDLTEFYQQTTVLLRPVRHDGLSFMVLEALARGRHVLYSRPLEGCINVADTDSICRELNRLYDLHVAGALQPNEAGRRYIARDYNRERVRSELLRRWRQIIEAPEPSFRKTSVPETG